MIGGKTREFPRGSQLASHFGQKCLPRGAVMTMNPQSQSVKVQPGGGVMYDPSHGGRLGRCAETGPITQRAGFDSRARYLRTRFQRRRDRFDRQARAWSRIAELHRRAGRASLAEDAEAAALHFFAAEWRELTRAFGVGLTSGSRE